jgi:hypothetical protein
VLRLAGLSGADAEAIPWVNRLTDAVRDQAGLEQGVALPVWDALRRSGDGDLTALAQRAAAGGVELRVPEGRTPSEPARTSARRWDAASPPSTGGAPSASGWSPDRRRPAAAVDLPDRRDRRHLRGHPAGAGGRA